MWYILILVFIPPFLIYSFHLPYSMLFFLFLFRKQTVNKQSKTQVKQYKNKIKNTRRHTLKNTISENKLSNVKFSLQQSDLTDLSHWIRRTHVLILILFKIFKDITVIQFVCQLSDPLYQWFSTCRFQTP